MYEELAQDRSSLRSTYGGICMTVEQGGVIRNLTRGYDTFAILALRTMDFGKLVEKVNGFNEPERDSAGWGGGTGVSGKVDRGSWLYFGSNSLTT